MEQDDKRPNVLFPAALVAGLVALGMLVQVPPYDRVRPSIPERWPEHVASGQDVDSRLWEDPFAPVQRHIREIKDLQYSDKALEEDLHSLNSVEWEKRLNVSAREERPTILIALAPASPYAESAEFRRRLRYAVLAGFSSFVLVPKHGKHIGYFETDRIGRKSSTGEGRLLRVPFEELIWDPLEVERTKHQPKRAVIFWLDADAIANNPIQGVRDLLGSVLGKCAVKPKCIEKYPIKVLGPLDSDSLLAFMKDGCVLSRDGRHKERNRVYSKVEFYTPTATLSDEYLQSALEKERQDRDKECKTSDIAKRFNLIRITNSGKVLLDLVAYELQRRGVDPWRKDLDSPGWAKEWKKFFISSFEGRSNRIAVVTEWDTLYGRASSLPFKELAKPCTENSDCRVVKLPDEGMYLFSYLRGLDGIGAPLLTAKDKAEVMGDKGVERKGKGRIERAEADAQVDYLRRLASRIKGMDQKFFANGQEGFGAIGILGTDFYDKLQVLQALRQEMPSKVFFTMEIDARYLHPEEQKWARNLIITSSFGLTLRRDLQRYIPPFRDSRQTAIFLATMLSLYGEESLDRKREMVSTWLGSPKGLIFEVGRSGAIELNNRTEEAGRKSECRPWKLKDCEYVQPEASLHVSKWPGEAISFRVLAAFLAVILFFLFIPPGRDGIVWKRRIWPMVGLGILAIVLTLIWDEMWSWSTGRDDPPLLFLEGVSIWPTLVLRVVTVSMACWFLLETGVRIRRCESELEAKYRLGDRAESCDEEKKLKWLHRLFAAEFSKNIRGGREDARFVNMERMWRHYKYLGDRKIRWKRVLLGAGGFLVLGFMVFALWPAHVPYRGGFSRSVHTGTILVAVGAMYILTFRVLEGMWLANQFLRRLADARYIAWPHALESTGEHARDGSQHIGLWTLMQFVQDMTKILNPLVFYPFAILTLMVISRSNIFAAWTVEPSILFAYLWAGALALGGGYYQRATAEMIRRRVLEQLTDILLAEKTNPKSSKEKQVELMIQEVKGLRRGAFAPITQQPALRALLLSVGGVGGTYLLEILSVVQ